MSLRAAKEAYRSMMTTERNQFLLWLREGCPDDPPKSPEPSIAPAAIPGPLDLKSLQQQEAEIATDWLARLDGTDKKGMTSHERFILGNRRSQAKALVHKEEDEAKDLGEQAS